MHATSFLCFSCVPLKMNCMGVSEDRRKYFSISTNDCTNTFLRQIFHFRRILGEGWKPHPLRTGLIIYTYKYIWRQYPSKISGPCTQPKNLPISNPKFRVPKPTPFTTPPLCMHQGKMKHVYHFIPPPSVLSRHENCTFSECVRYSLEAVIWEVSPFMQISRDVDLQVPTFTEAAVIKLSLFCNVVLPISN